jgi:hypothetical protein
MASPYMGRFWRTVRSFAMQARLTVALATTSAAATVPGGLVASGSSLAEPLVGAATGAGRRQEARGATCERRASCPKRQRPWRRTRVCLKRLSPLDEALSQKRESSNKNRNPLDLSALGGSAIQKKEYDTKINQREVALALL